MIVVVPVTGQADLNYRSLLILTSTTIPSHRDKIYSKINLDLYEAPFLALDGVVMVLPRQSLDIPTPTPSNLLKLRRTVLQVYFAELGASQSQYWELPVSI